MSESLPTMTLGEHLEELRVRLLRVAVAVMALSVVIFCLKEATFRLLLAPCSTDFVTFRAIERASDWLAQCLSLDGGGFRFEPWHIELISTELSAQFMVHVSSSACLGTLLASPYILYQLYLYVRPALYAGERRYGLRILLTVTVLFALGVLMTYFILFPVSLRFLGTYQVAATVHNFITLDSYVSTFATLTFLMGLVFQMPVVAWMLARAGLLRSDLMARYRRHAVVAIAVVSAIITPPDVFTLVLVSVPLYLLYEVCIHIVRGTVDHQHHRV